MKRAYIAAVAPALALAGGAAIVVVAGARFTTAALLTIAFAPLFAVAIATIRSLGVWNPTFLSILAVATYFPVRGFVVTFGHITPGNGLNGRVASALESGSDHRAAVIAVVICWAYALGLAVALRPGT